MLKSCEQILEPEGILILVSGLTKHLGTHLQTEARGLKKYIILHFVSSKDAGLIVLEALLLRH